MSRQQSLFEFLDRQKASKTQRERPPPDLGKIALKPEQQNGSIESFVGYHEPPPLIIDWHASDQQQKKEGYDNYFAVERAVPESLLKLKAEHADELSTGFLLGGDLACSEQCVMSARKRPYEWEWIACDKCEGLFHRGCMLSFWCTRCDPYGKRAMCPVCSCMHRCDACSAVFCFKSVSHRLVGKCYLCCATCLFDRKVRAEVDVRRVQRELGRK